MPKFLDHHALPPLSPEQKKAMTDQVKSMVASKKADKFGVTMLNSFMTPAEAWGYSDAPNAEAVVKSHEAMGIKILVKDVKQVEAII